MMCFAWRLNEIGILHGTINSDEVSGNVCITYTLGFNGVNQQVM